MDRQRYTLYLDETGDRGLVKFDRRYPVLGLCGVIVEDDAYRGEVVPALDAFKVSWFGTAQLTLHYSTIMKRVGPYVIFRDGARLHAFEQDFAALVSRLPLSVLAAVINKSEYTLEAARVPSKDPTWPSDLYYVAVDFVVERFVEFLEHRKGTAGGFVAEARAHGGRLDQELVAHYARRRLVPTQFYSAERFAVLPPAIEIRTKDDRVAGLELADLLAPQIASRVLGHDEARLLIVS